MRRAGTLQGRLAAVAVLTTAVWVGLLTVGFNLLLAAQLQAQSGAVLRQSAAAGAATVAIGPGTQVTITDPPDDEALDSDLWIYAGGRALERPRAPESVQRRADSLAGTGERFARLGGRNPARLFALPIRQGGRQVATVVAAVSLDPYRHMASLALAGSVALAVLLLAGVYAAGRLAIGRALAPVQQMSTQAAEWSAHDAVERFGAHARPAELARLAANLDGVLDRQAALLRHEQQVTEELSHELRTPLSLLTAEVDLLRSRRRSAAETRAALARIAEGTAHLEQIVETLLSAARSRADGSVGRCSVHLAVAGLRRQLPPGAPELVLSGPDVTAGVDAEVLQRILSPVLDNAVRYAVSRIDVVIAATSGGAVVRVSDDGPGVAPELGDSVFEPGRRDVSTSPDGAGLGLALARRLARAAGGDLILSGGAFELQVPHA